VTTSANRSKTLTWTPDDRFVVFGARGLFRVPSGFNPGNGPCVSPLPDDSALDRLFGVPRKPGEPNSRLHGPSGTPTFWGWRIGGGGSAPVRVATSTMADHGPTISPDGAKDRISSGRTGIEQIWVAGSDGSNPGKLTFFESGLCATSPSFSPDGKSIAF